MTLHEFLIRIGVALILGTIIGAEREWRQKLAGLKTNALVCVGAALFSTLGFAYGDSTDQSRIAAQIASGIGFLGAGAILRDGMNIRGLTTAATVWCAAAVGAMAGAGWIVQSAIGAICVFFCNLLLKEIARLLFRGGGFDSLNEYTLDLHFVTNESQLSLRESFLALLKDNHMTIRGVVLEPTEFGMSWHITAHVTEQHEEFNPEKLAHQFMERFQVSLGWKLA